jgi:hypothetical protein
MKHFSTIKTPEMGVAKDKVAGKAMSAPKAKMPSGLGVINAVENKEGQDSGFKKKRLHAVESLKYPK